MKRHRTLSVPPAFGRVAAGSLVPAVAGLLAAVCLAEPGLGGDFQPPARPVPVSVNSDNGRACRSWHPLLSADGRMIAFTSDTTTPACADRNRRWAFVRDLATGVTTRLDIDSTGLGPDRCTWSSAMSAGGRFVAFGSMLTREGPQGMCARAIFVRDLVTGSTEIVSIASPSDIGTGLCWARGISEDGRFVAFVSGAADLVENDTNGARDAFVHDRSTDTTSRVSVSSSGGESNGRCNWHDISGDGRFVVFDSDASNLVEGDTNGKTDVFLHDRTSGRTTRISVNSTGGQANGTSKLPAISLDGRFVVFESEASNFVPEDTESDGDVFVRDLSTGTTEIVSAAPALAGFRACYGSISGSGRFVLFQARSGSILDMRVYVHDRRIPATALVFRGGVRNSDVLSSHISDDGRTIAYRPPASHVFVAANPLFDAGVGLGNGSEVPQSPVEAPAADVDAEPGMSPEARQSPAEEPAASEPNPESGQPNEF